MLIWLELEWSEIQSKLDYFLALKYFDDSLYSEFIHTAIIWENGTNCRSRYWIHVHFRVLRVKEIDFFLVMHTCIQIRNSFDTSRNGNFTKDKRGTFKSTQSTSRTSLITHFHTVSHIISVCSSCYLSSHSNVYIRMLFTSYSRQNSHVRSSCKYFIFFRFLSETIFQYIRIFLTYYPVANAACIMQVYFY